VEWLAGANTNFAHNKTDRGGLAAVYPDPPKKKGIVLLFVPRSALFANFPFYTREAKL
jgi:hypothetical protein